MRLELKVKLNNTEYNAPEELDRSLTAILREGWRVVEKEELEERYYKVIIEEENK